MRTLRLSRWLLTAFFLLPAVLCAQNRAARTSSAELHLRVQPTPATHRKVVAVVWLEPLGDTPVLSFTPQGHYTLLQKNRMFMPHLQVVPIGSVVQFPNADPFFHNVFSLYDGKRFDLGLYETGTTKSVTFSRPGVSYIFCNIHPEMSAVVISLSTPLYATADATGSVTIHNIPAGDYVMHVWVEGALPPALQGLPREIKISPGMNDLGTMSVPIGSNATHTNKFGNTYDHQPTSPY
jgi:plastocyanin